MVAIRSIVERLSLREKAGQVVFPAFSFDAPDVEGITDLVNRGVGGLRLYRGSVFDAPFLLNTLQKTARWPLLVCSELEDGAGQQIKGATLLPSNMAVGASGREDMARLKGLITATEARALGIHWNLAPVVDVNSAAKNPMINVRAFGDSPDLVVKMASSYLKGMAAGKAMNGLKHFPGVGTAECDPFLELPTISPEFSPFEALASAADSIITAHARAPALDSKRPAALSAGVVDLLRTRIKFQGIVAVDAMAMGGLANLMSEEEAILLALQAGNDAVMVPQDPWGAIDFIEQAVKNRKLDVKLLDQACLRLLQAKERMGLFDSRVVTADGIEKFLAMPTHRNAMRQMAEAALTLVSDQKKLLPLKKGRVGYFSLVDASAADTEDQFIKALARHLGAVEAEQEEDYDVYVVGLFIKPRPLSGRIEFQSSDVRRVTDKISAGKKIILVSFGSPYVLRQFPGASACVLAFSDCDASQEAASRALAGKIRMPGSLPVKL